jgi:hypothetical protein
MFPQPMNPPVTPATPRLLSSQATRSEPARGRIEMPISAAIATSNAEAGYVRVADAEEDWVHRL